MTYEEAKQTFIDFTKNGIYGAAFYGDNDDLLEQFFDFIGQLEDCISDDERLYLVLTDCYLQLQNNKKAKAAFLHIYNKSNSKDLKKLYDMEHCKSKNITRPSKRKKKLPIFQYVKQELLEALFCYNKTELCCICGKSEKPLYYGRAYDSADHLFSFVDRDDHVCADCIKSGDAAKKLNFSFNSRYLLNTKINEAKTKELVFRTPCFDDKFGLVNEDGWSSCCGDYAVFSAESKDDYEFECSVCKTKIIWKKYFD